MKKRVLTVIVLSLVTACISSKADVFVTWRSGGVFILGDTVGGTLGTTPNSVSAAGSTNSVLLQLIWSPDNSANLASETYGPSLVGDGEFLLDSFIITEAGTSATRFASFAGGSRPDYHDGGSLGNSGYVYGRIFETDTPTAGDWYYTGLLVATQNLDPSGVPTPTAQMYSIVPTTSEFVIGSTRTASVDSTGATSPELWGFSAQVLPVPEPGTMALFALGAATLAASRRRRKVQA